MTLTTVDADERPASRTPPALFATLLGDRNPGVREVAVAFMALTALAVAVFGTHVVNGGFLMDDWNNAGKTRFLSSCCGPGVSGTGSGYATQVSNLLRDGPAGYHAGLPVIIPVVFRLFGPTIGPHLVLAVALGVAMSASLYAVLRVLRMPALHAFAVAALVLVFPFSDSTRLWAMAGYNQIAVVLWLLGLLVALRGLRATGRGGVLLHAGAMVLYALGIVVYELVAGAVLLSVVAYGLHLLGTAPAKRTLALRWVADAVATGAALSVVLLVALPRTVIPFEQQVRFGLEVLDDSLTLLSRAALPVWTAPRLAVCLPLVAVLVIAIVARRRAAAADPLRARLGYWLLTVAGGAVVVCGGYALAVAGGYAGPLSLGIENRVNMIAGVGYMLIVYGTLCLAGHLVTSRTVRLPGIRHGLPLAGAAVLGAAYSVQVHDSATDYDRSFATQLVVLDRITARGPYPPFATIYAFGYPTFVRPGVPTFAWNSDLNSAAKVALDDPSPGAYPVLPGTTFDCGPTAVTPVTTHLGFPPVSPYGNSFFLDVETGKIELITDRAVCEAATGEFLPGPLVEGRACALVGEGAATGLPWTCASDDS